MGLVLGFPVTEALHWSNLQDYPGHFRYQSVLEKVFRQVIQRSDIAKRAMIHMLRQSFATQLLQGGCDTPTVLELLGHSSLETTMIYTHAAKKKNCYRRSD